MECHDQRDLAPRSCTALVHRKVKNSTYMYVHTCIHVCTYMYVLFFNFLCTYAYVVHMHMLYIYMYVHVYIVHIKLSSGIESLHVYSSQDHDCVHFNPHTFTLSPHTVTNVTVECRPLTTGRLRSTVQCVVEGKVAW